jgi:hypothetical protein
MDDTQPTTKSESTVTVKKEPAKPKVLTDEQIYPPRILKVIKDLETSKDSKRTRYILFDQEVGKVIPFKPSDRDLKFYTQFVLSDYKKISLEYIQGLSDSDLLKIIYRNRPVDLYFAHREIYNNPLGGVAYNVIQIAREQYEGTLTSKLYKLYKQTLDGHFNNINKEEPTKSKVLTEEEKEKKRKEQYKSCFSPWDGSHLNLKYYIEDNMNDPDSFEHVETVYQDMVSVLIVEMTFRGNNQFGALVKNTVRARVSADDKCTVLKILDQR